MIQEVHQACEKLNERLGTSVPLPTPGKKALKAAAARNFAAGVGLLAAGVMFPSKLCIVLGGVGLAGSAVLRKEAGLKSKEPRRSPHP